MYKEKILFCFRYKRFYISPLKILYFPSIFLYPCNNKLYKRRYGWTEFCINKMIKYAVAKM